MRIEQLESENGDLKAELRSRKGAADEEEQVGFAGNGNGGGSWK